MKGSIWEREHVGKDRWPPAIGKWRIKGWDFPDDDAGGNLSAFYQGDGDKSAFWIHKAGYTRKAKQRGPREWFTATEETPAGDFEYQGSKADMLKVLSGADKPVHQMTAQELCGIGDKACRAELKRRGRDPKTGKKRR